MTNEKITVVSVLGAAYIVRESEPEKDVKLDGRDGYTDTSIRECVIDSMRKTDESSKTDLQEYKKSVVRHELIHAFLYESGLDSCSWATNEEMVDWIAIQFPKLLKAFEEAGCL